HLPYLTTRLCAPLSSHRSPHHRHLSSFPTRRSSDLRLREPRPAPRPGGRVRLLIVLPGALGDVIRALPLLGRIRRTRPDSCLGWAVEPPSAPLLAGHPWLDRVHVFERPRGVRALLPFLQRVRRERYQVALDLGRGIKSALIAWASGASERIGFARADGREAGRLPATRRVSPQGIG